MFFTIFVFIIFIFILLLFLDFKMGRKDHQKKIRTLQFKKTKADYKLYKDGSPMYEDLFQDIANATKQVDVYFYLIDNDYISHEFLQVLKNKAEEGIPVRLLADRLGSFKINKKIRRDLRQSGIDFHFAEKLGFPYFFYRSQRRNHRKIAIIDGEISFVGGFNIGKNYIGESPTFRDWRDYHLRLKGPVVEELHEVFLDDWYLATGEKDTPLKNNIQAKHDVRVIATDGAGLENEMLEMIESAEKEILIGTPYFIPTPTLLQALESALERGVEIHIMIPNKKDHPLVKEAGLPYLVKLCTKGAKVGFFDAGFYHAKVVMVDGRLADIGTANFDRRSLFLNKEVNLFVFNEKFIHDLRDMYFKDFEDAIPLDDQWLRKRTFQTKVYEFFAVLLRPFL